MNRRKSNKDQDLVSLEMVEVKAKKEFSKMAGNGDAMTSKEAVTSKETWPVGTRIHEMRK